MRGKKKSGEELREGEVQGFLMKWESRKERRIYNQCEDAEEELRKQGRRVEGERMNKVLEMGQKEQNNMWNIVGKEDK